MELHPDVIDEQGGIVRKDGSVTPVNAADILAEVIDRFRANGIPLPSEYKGILARKLKKLLEDGFQWQTLTLASATAIKRGEPHNLHHIALDFVLAGKGMKMTRAEYEKALQDEMEIGGFR